MFTYLLAAGTRTSSKFTWRVGCTFQPILSSLPPKLRPLDSLGTSTVEIDSPVRHITRYQSDKPATQPDGEVSESIQLKLIHVAKAKRKKINQYLQIIAHDTHLHR